ncbi:endonuclease/exonuclease/phosphatase family protein [Saccharicrinis sp. FJH54]|uniref:endonuclease/exonuclease/phosphatase family protein n=1 Tax=Saccharicrinis sp. FJH54 TaxID=3344665 RepID=UPI0035D4C828
MKHPTLEPLNLFLSPKRNKTLLLIILFITPVLVNAQNEKECKVMFYNVENMFDHMNDSLTNDGEFTPEGQRHWTSYKATQKINNIARVIIAAGGMNPVDLVGLAEVENRYVLDKLTRYSPLQNLRYAVIHKESPDRRGIDVALLYKKTSYSPLINRYIPVTTSDPEFRTRDILYSKGILNRADTVHIFVNHWPSRYGGVVASRPLRCKAATILKSMTDSILSSNLNSNIIIMGDFNDYPCDESITKCLGAGKKGRLVNLALYSDDDGSYKYQGRWGFLDQFIVSSSLYERKSNGLILLKYESVISFPFMLEKDDKYTGDKPFRTFSGYRYNGGFSDHLPVMIILK